MGCPSEKGEKKTPGINPRQHHLKYTEAGSTIHSEPARKRRKKNPPGYNPGQPAGKGREKKTCPSVCRGPKTRRTRLRILRPRWTNRRTTQLIYKIVHILKIE